MSFVPGDIVGIIDYPEFRGTVISERETNKVFREGCVYIHITHIEKNRIYKVGDTGWDRLENLYMIKSTFDQYLDTL